MGCLQELLSAINGTTRLSRSSKNIWKQTPTRRCICRKYVRLSAQRNEPSVPHVNSILEWAQSAILLCGECTLSAALSHERLLRQQRSPELPPITGSGNWDVSRSPIAPCLGKPLRRHCNARPMISACFSIGRRHSQTIFSPSRVRVRSAFLPVRSPLPVFPIGGHSINNGSRSCRKRATN